MSDLAGVYMHTGKYICRVSGFAKQSMKLFASLTEPAGSMP